MEMSLKIKKNLSKINYFNKISHYNELLTIIFFLIISFLKKFKEIIIKKQKKKKFDYYSFNLKNMEQANEDFLKLIEAIKKIGKKQTDGSVQTTFLEIFEETESYLESLNGTLRSAKKQKKITFDGEMLLKPKNNKTIITLLP